MKGIDNALGLSPQVLALRAQRMNLLSQNIANADTPHYKARDIDFQGALAAATSARESALATRHDKHFAVGEASLASEPLYRVPQELSINGNTVEPHREHSEFMDNAVRYQASLNLLDSRIKGLRAAIKGE